MLALKLRTNTKSTWAQSNLQQGNVFFCFFFRRPQPRPGSAMVERHHDLIAAVSDVFFGVLTLSRKDGYYIYMTFIYGF